MTEFEEFLSQAKRVWGRKIAREAARIYCERGREAAAKFLRGFQLYEPPIPPGDPIRLLGDGRAGNSCE